MIKKTLIALILGVSILAFSVPASATSSIDLDDQIYAISGKITAKIDIRDMVTLSITIPKVERFEEKFFFFYDGTFMDQLLYTASDSSYTTGISYPTWSQSGSNFTVDLSDLSSSIESALGSYIDIGGGPTKSPVITGKISKDGKTISGTMNLGWNISTYVEGYGNISGSLTVTMKYKGTYWGYLTYSSLLMKDAEKSESKMAFQKALKDAIVNVLSALPKQAKQPAQ
jgi:hypothetical protein